MKYNFRKISAVAMSILTLGLTAGVAPLVSGANYPAPFVDGGQADFAVVHGGSNAAATDQSEATSVANSLLALSTSVGLGSESVKLERSSDFFNLGDDATDVFVTAITDDHLPTLLADGTYRDEDNDEFAYTQKIDLGSNIDLTHFRDTDLSTTPTIGIKVADGAHVLNYTLDFSKDPTFTAAKMENSDLPFMGTTYFVLDVDTTNDALTLLDSAVSTTVSESETVTVTAGGVSYEVTPTIFGSSNVKLSINGEVTPTLSKGDTYKLNDGAYIGLEDLVIQDYAGGQKLAEFSIGAGKLKLTDGQEVELNDNSVSGLTAHVTNNSGKLDKIILEWDTDDEEFITPTSEVTLPAFGNIKLSMTGFTMPAQETIEVENDGTTTVRLVAPIKSGTATVPLLFVGTDGLIDGIGDDADNLLITSSNRTVTFNETANHDQFVASWNSTSEGESYLLSADVTESTSLSANVTDIRNEVTGSLICEDLKPSDTCTVGNMVLTIDSAYDVGANEWVTITVSSGGSFNTLYTEEGLKAYLPYEEANGSAKGSIDLDGGAGESVGHNQTSWYLFFEEEDKDSNLEAGDGFNITLKSNSDNEFEAQTVNVNGDTSGKKIGDSGDRYEYYVTSDLATKVVHDRTSGSQRTATVTYHGDQAYGNVFVSSADASGGLEIGDVLVTDSEVSSVQSRNLIVIGGSCVNSVAADLVGGAYCGSAWTDATGVGSGEFVIESFDNPDASGKVALLVAGYERDDTVNAATYLRQQGSGTNIDVGQKYTGTTSTSVEAVVA